MESYCALYRNFLRKIFFMRFYRRMKETLLEQNLTKTFCRPAYIRNKHSKTFTKMAPRRDAGHLGGETEHRAGAPRAVIFNLAEGVRR